MNWIEYFIDEYCFVVENVDMVVGDFVVGVERKVDFGYFCEYRFNFVEVCDV